jgi:hypothetical protein
MVFLLFLALITDKKKRKQQYLIVCFVATSCCATIIFIIMSPRSHREKFCRDNATTLNYHDGPSICVAQGAILMYTALACCLAWLSQCVDLMLKLVLSLKTEIFWPAYLSVIFLLPLIPTIITGANGWFGYSRVLPWCFLSDSVPMPENVDIALFYLPIAIISGLGTIVMSTVIYKITSTIGRVSNGISDKEKTSRNKLEAKVKAAKTPILFVVMFLIVW